MFNNSGTASYKDPGNTYFMLFGHIQLNLVIYEVVVVIP